MYRSPGADVRLRRRSKRRPRTISSSRTGRSRGAATEAQLRQQAGADRAGRGRGVAASLREAVKISWSAMCRSAPFSAAGSTRAIVALMSSSARRRCGLRSASSKRKYDDSIRTPGRAAVWNDPRGFVFRPNALRSCRAWWHTPSHSPTPRDPDLPLSELTRRHVTVALNGDAGDENFAGYERYPPTNWRAATTHGLARSATPPCRPARTNAPRVRRSGSLLSRSQRFLALSRGSRAPLPSLDAALPAAAQDRAGRRSSAKCGPRSGRDPAALLCRLRCARLVDATLDVDVNNYLPDICWQGGYRDDGARIGSAFAAARSSVDGVRASLPRNMKLKGASRSTS